MTATYKRLSKPVLVLCLLASITKPACANVISNWNKITVAATKIAGYNSNLGSRIEAIEAIAVYDAVNAVKHFGTPYHYAAQLKGPASAEAAAAQAAHDVLAHYFPAQKALFDSALAASLAALHDGPAGYGPATGTAAAADIIALRANDGAEPNVGYPGPAKPGVGQYRPTPSSFAPGINQQWGNVKPFLLGSANQFRPGPPPAPGTAAFKKALDETVAWGGAKSNLRTEDQTHIAQFYKQDAELTVNEAARLLVEQSHTTLEKSALVFLLVDIAEADARIAIWDAKYYYLFWRPVTAMNADADGSVTNNYSAWTPLLVTPPHPSYPCGHCGTVNAGFEVLKRFFGDKHTLELHTSTDGEPARVITSLTQGEEENSHSRIFGGIHYPFDNEASQKLGNQVAKFVLAQGPHMR